MIAATDVADLLVRRGVPFRQSHGIVAGLVRVGGLVGPLAVGAHARRAGRALRRARRRVLRGALRAVVAGVEDLRGRHRPRPGARAARPRARGARRPAGVTSDFFARPVLEVAPDLLGCVVSHGDVAGVIVETEAYHYTEPAAHSFAGLTERTRVMFESPPGTAYVYRSYGIHALLNAVCEPGSRGPDPRAGAAAGGGRRCAPGGASRASRTSATARASSPRRWGWISRSTARRCSTGPVRIARGRAARARGGDADRDHQGRRAAVALLRAGSRFVSRPWPPGSARAGRLSARRDGRDVRRLRAAISAGLAGSVLRRRRGQPRRTSTAAGEGSGLPRNDHRGAANDHDRRSVRCTTFTSVRFLRHSADKSTRTESAMIDSRHRRPHSLTCRPFAEPAAARGHRAPVFLPAVRRARGARTPRTG